MEAVVLIRKPRYLLMAVGVAFVFVNVDLPHIFSHYVSLDISLRKSPTFCLHSSE